MARVHPTGESTMCGGSRVSHQNPSGPSLPLSIALSPQTHTCMYAMYGNPDLSVHVHTYLYAMYGNPDLLSKLPYTDYS